MKPRLLLEDLDWSKLLGFAQAEARTPYGKARIATWSDPAHFAQSADRAQELQHETQEIYTLLDRAALWGPLGGLEEIHDELESLSKGGVLEARALARIRSWLYCFDSWSTFPQEFAGKLFKQALTHLFIPQDALRVLERVLSPAGDISERASPELYSILSSAKDVRREISIRMEQLTRDYAEKGFLQEKYSDVRDGRYVLPVKVSDQSKIDGRVAELSVSKQTVFIEPKEVEQLQSRLRRLEADAAQEIFRILLGVARTLKPHADAISSGVALVSYWDSVQARARLATVYGGKPITLSPEREWILHDTVNPILFWNLPESEIVRNSVELRQGQQMILLSGPNTGGKTVLLKTMGLSAVCARSGFFYPGTGKLLVPYFDSFFVDLGDPQSIEEHISSFSGHVLKMKRILEGQTESSLILVDEMNSATDPEEGAALALAFVQTVLAKPGAILIATTHDPKLKAMGMGDSRVLNASILFDEATMKPTYRVVYGAPGRSRALETAERLGMPESVLKLAKSYLTDEHKVIESVLGQLQGQLGSVDRARAAAEQLRDEAEKLKLEWAEKVKVTVQESIEKARQKLKHVLELAQIEVRETLRKIQSTKSHKGLDEIRRELNDAFEAGEKRIGTSVLEAAPELTEVLEAQGASAIPTPVKFEKGAWVRVPKWKNVGEIVDWDGKRAKVALGPRAGSGFAKAFVVAVYPVEMELLSEREMRTVLGVQTGGKPASSKKVTMQALEVGSVPEQVDVRGQRLDDAIREVTHYIDRAFRSGRAEVVIIHGLGTGALREGIRGLLKKTNYVATYDDAGTTGSTRIRFAN